MSEFIFFYEAYCISEEIVYNKSKEIVYCDKHERFKEKYIFHPVIPVCLSL